MAAPPNALGAHHYQAFRGGELDKSVEPGTKFWGVHMVCVSPESFIAQC
jgi:hypothetical protein